MTRFVTFLEYGSDEVRALSEAQFKEAKHAQDPLVSNDGWEEWVWQFAETSEQAIQQHWEKMNAWHQDPDRETY